MAKGAVSKQEVAAQILDAFQGSFMYNNNKEIRIPWMEDGNEVQIKVTLTCAKDMVEPEDDEAAFVGKTATKEDIEINFTELQKPKVEPTDEEKATVEELLARLGMR